MRTLMLFFSLLSIQTISLAQNYNNMKWYNEPKSWKINGNKIEVNVDGGTDYWRITHYNFIRDNGHFFFQEMEGEFVAKVKIKGNYKELYDQAGLMIRTDEKNWIKTGIEFVNGVQNLSAVVTREFSDWSVVQRKDNPSQVNFTLLRKGDYVEIQYSFDDKNYQMLRLAYFPPKVKVQIGIMCAAPDGKGFPVAFEDFTITPVK